MRTDVISPEDGDASSRTAWSASADYLDRAVKVADLVEREADETERAGTMTQPVIDALVESNLFWILLPSDLGGGGQGVVPFLEVAEELTRADGSSGWSYMANAGSIGVAAGFLQPEATREMFGGPSKAITAGQLGPIGRGTEIEDGSRCSGNYQFGSGSAHATWIGGGFLVEEAGSIQIGADGTPDARIAFLPRDRATFLGNWDVTGLVGTGSHDYRIDDQAVPREFTYPRTGATPVRGEPVFALGHVSLGIAGHAAVALGLRRRGHRWHLALIPTRHRISGWIGLALSNTDEVRWYASPSSCVPGRSSTRNPFPAHRGTGGSRPSAAVPGQRTWLRKPAGQANSG